MVVEAGGGRRQEAKEDSMSACLEEQMCPLCYEHVGPPVAVAPLRLEHLCSLCRAVCARLAPGPRGIVLLRRRLQGCDDDGRRRRVAAAADDDDRHFEALYAAARTRFALQRGPPPAVVAADGSGGGGGGEGEGGGGGAADAPATPPLSPKPAPPCCSASGAAGSGGSLTLRCGGGADATCGETEGAGAAEADAGVVDAACLLGERCVSAVCGLVHEIPEEYVCPVCLETLEDPHQCQDGHTLCLACWQGCLDASEDARCPLDNLREVSKSRLVPNRLLRGLIDKWKAAGAARVKGRRDTTAAADAPAADADVRGERT